MIGGKINSCCSAEDLTGIGFDDDFVYDSFGTDVSTGLKMMFS